MLGRHFQASTFLRDVRGAAAAEFVLCLPLVIAPIVGMVDLGIFAVQRMQVDAASQAGAAAAWHVCDDPDEAVSEATCGEGDVLAAAITAGVQSTTLGDSVTEASTPIAGYYCAPAGGGDLELVSDSTWAIDGTPAVKPGTCGDGNTNAPAQYIQVTVNFTYTPVFGALVAAGVLPETITRTSWRRIS